MRHACGTPDPTWEVSKKPQSRYEPVLSFLHGLGVIATFLIAVLALAAMVSPARADPVAGAPSAERQLELTRFVRQECGFCHGLRLTGGLGSPLTAQALAGKPPEVLEAAILHGLPGTAMPGWQPFLKETDVAWIVTMLLQGFPE